MKRYLLVLNFCSDIKKVLYVGFVLLLFHPFKSNAQFVFVGDAGTTSSDCSAGITTYELTADLGSEYGAIWYTTQVSLTQQFDIQFEIFLGNKAYSVGADGMCFVFQQQSTNAGTLGGGMGYGGILPSIAAEFDTYQNGWDPAYCHTAIEKNGDVDHTDGTGNNLAGPVQLSPTGASLPDGDWHTAEITWNPTTNVFSVYFDCSLRVSYTGNIIANIFGGNPNVYWGFTAGTGGAENLQEVCILHSYLNNLRDTSVCSGDPVTYTASGGVTYVWSPAAGLNTTTGATVIATPTITTNYTCVSTNSCGLATTQTVTVTISPAPNITMTPTDVLCNGGKGSVATIVTGGIAPYTYVWTPAGGNTATASNLTIGTYTVKVTSNTGCSSTADATITEPTAIGTTTSFMPASCNLSNGSATVSPTGGTAPYTYAWSGGGGTTPTALNMSAGTYSVVVTDNHGCTTTANVTVTQPSAVTATMGGLTYPLCNGGNGTATVTVTGGSIPYTYGWNPTLQTTATANGLSAGTYTVAVSDANGCVSTTTAVITQPTLLTATTVMTQATCGNSNGTATVTASGGTGAYIYAWAPTGGNAATANGLSASTYTATVTDNNLCTATSVIVVTGTPAITISTVIVNNVSCFGGNNGSATANGAGGTGPYQYGWLTNPPQLTQTANGLSAGTYSVGTEDAGGCTATTTVTITQPAILTATTSSTQASCNLYNGSAAVAPAGGTAPYTYAWGTAPVQTTVTAAGISAGTYSVLVTDNNGCTTTSSVTVTQPSAVTVAIVSSTGVSCFDGDNGTATADANGGNAPYGYAWSGPGGNAATGTGFSVGTYTITAHDANGCISTATVLITQPTVLAADITGPSLICIGSTGTLTANVTGGTMPYAYEWPGNPSIANTASVTGSAIPQTYSVIVTDANGCAVTAVFTINPGPPVSAVITGNTSICPGQSTTLCVTASGGTGGDTYTWQSGNYSTPCITLSPTISTAYTVTVTDNCGMIGTASTAVSVNPYPVVNFTSDLSQGCTPLCVQFYNTTTIPGGNAQSYAWLFGNGDSAQSKSPIYCYPDSGTYNISLTVTSDSGCSATLEKAQMIKVFTAPIAAFTMSPQPTTILNPTIQFTNQSTDAYPISYSFWTFGDASDSTSMVENPSHTYQDTGTYCASLIVMDEHGCTDTTTNCLVINPIFNIYIPSAFTPNGNGLNETFTAKGEYIKTFEMYIFDRWGEQLYHTTDINTGWNGTTKGGSAVSQEDIYVYKILATDMENTQHSYVGSVSLLK